MCAQSPFAGLVFKQIVGIVGFTVETVGSQLVIRCCFLIGFSWSLNAVVQPGGQIVRFAGQTDLSATAGKAVVLRFTMKVLSFTASPFAVNLSH